MNGVAYGWRVIVECCVFTSKSFSALASDPTSSFSENTIEICVFPSLSPWCFWVRKEIESEYNQLNFLKINNALIKPISLPKTVLTWRVSLSAILELKLRWTDLFVVKIFTRIKMLTLPRETSVHDWCLVWRITKSRVHLKGVFGGVYSRISRRVICSIKCINIYIYFFFSYLSLI